MYRIVLLPLAGKDIRVAIEWYDEKSYGLGEKFREEVFAQIDRIKDDFLERGPVYEGVSRVLVKKFPYIIYYQKDPVTETITVYAVLHKKQDKGILSKRV